MLVNRKRGEIVANLGGKDRCLCLTLGALAKLESAFQAGDLAALGQRFSSGRLSARDLMVIIHAGLEGGGNTFTLDDVAEMQADGGLAGYAAIVSELLSVTFGAPDGD